MSYITIASCPVCGAVFDVVQHAGPEMGAMSGAMLIGPERRAHARVSPSCRIHPDWIIGWKMQTHEANYFDQIAELLAKSKRTPEPKTGYWTVASMIECLRKYPQGAVILGVFETLAIRSGLKVASDNDADPTKATTVYIEVLE
jgi:hypothetical protein